MDNKLNLASSVGICLLVALVSCSALLVSGMGEKYIIAIVIAAIFLLIFLVSKNKSNILFAALILSLPFATTGILLGPLPTTIHTSGAQVYPKINIVDIILIIFIFFKILQGKSSFGTSKKTSKIIIISWISFVIWCGLSIILSEYKMLGIISFYELLKISVLCFVLVKHIKHEEQIKFAVKLLVFGLAIEGALGIYQAILGSPPWLPVMTHGDTTNVENVGDIVIQRVGGTIGWTTVFAQYLALLTPLPFYVLIASSKKKYFLIFGMAFILAFIALIYTYSRAGILSLVFGLIVSGYCLFHKSTPSVRKRLLITSTCFVLLFLISLPVITVRSMETDQGSAASRIPMFRVASNIIAENPILGTGLNSYTEIMHKYDPSHLLDGFRFAVHNVYLFIAAEVGIPGLLFFMIFMGWVIYQLVSTIERASQSMSAISAGFLGGILAVLLHGMVEQSFKGDIQLWYVLSAICGLSIAIVQIVDTEESNPSMASNR